MNRNMGRDYDESIKLAEKEYEKLKEEGLEITKHPSFKDEFIINYSGLASTIGGIDIMTSDNAIFLRKTVHFNEDMLNGNFKEQWNDCLISFELVDDEKNKTQKYQSETGVSRLLVDKSRSITSYPNSYNNPNMPSATYSETSTLYNGYSTQVEWASYIASKPWLIGGYLQNPGRRINNVLELKDNSLYFNGQVFDSMKYNIFRRPSDFSHIIECWEGEKNKENGVVYDKWKRYGYGGEVWSGPRYISGVSIDVLLQDEHRIPDKYGRFISNDAKIVDYCSNLTQEEKLAKIMELQARYEDLDNSQKL